MHDPTVTAPREAAPSLTHRFNNFLTVCMTHAEVALESREPEELEAALRWILEGAQAIAPDQTAHVQHQLDYGQDAQEVSRG